MIHADIQKLRDSGLITDGQRRKVIWHFRIKKDTCSNFLFIVCFLGAVMLCAGCASTSSVHPQFTSRTRGLTNLVVMPVLADAIEWQASGAQRTALPQEGPVVQQLKSLIAQQFQSRGFEVVESKLVPADPGTITNDVSYDRESWMQLQVQRAYQTLRRVGGYARGNIVRPEAPLLADYEKADALVFVTASVVTESSGARAKRHAFNTGAFIVGLAAVVLDDPSSMPFMEGSPAGSNLEVILVEGRTGEILWRSCTYNDSPDPERFGTAVQKLFSDYPDQQRDR